MASPKALILQGILGVAGLCASSAAGVGLSLDKAFGGVQSDQAATDSADEPGINPQTIKVVDVNDDLGIPKECDTTCVLTEKQLRNLKFEQKGDDGIKYEGLEDSDEFELIVEVTEDQTNYPKGKKYTLKPKTISGPVTIKNIKEGDIVLEGTKEVVIRETISGKKLEHLLEEVNGLGIPKRCESDQVEGATTKTCELTKLQLQKLKFEAKKGEEVKAQGQNEGNIVTLKIEDKKDDLNNYPKGKKYTLTSNGYVVITGEKGGDITLKNGEEILIRETNSGGKLEHLLEELNELGIPNRCVVEGAPNPCPIIQKQLEDLKFEPKEGTSIAVDGQSDNSKFELIIEDKKGDLNYPKGKKYKIQSKGTEAKIKNVKDGDIDIWKNQFVVIREKKEGGKLEKAPEEVDYLGIPESCTTGKTCHLTAEQLKKLQFETKDDGGITIDGLPVGKTVELKVEDKSNDRDNYPRGKKYTLSSKSKTVTIKNLKDEDITIGKEGIVFREKEGVKKLEIAPEEIDHLGIPSSRCIPGLTCQLTKEQFEKLKFETRNNEKISVEGLEGDNTVDLRVSGVTGDIDNYPKWKKYTLKSTSGTVTIRNAKDKDIVLEENKAVDFREIKTGNKLETSLDILGIPRGCGAEEIKRGSEPKTCYLSSDQLKDLRFENFEGVTGDVKVEGLTEKIALTISWDEDQNTYPDNKKYSFDNSDKEKKDIKISKGGQDLTIAKQKKSWFKNNGGKLAIAEIKTKSQIEMEEKIKELKEILKQIGLEGLQIGDFVNGSSTKRQQTYIEFKNAEGLKKIQFKELGGVAEYINSSSFSRIQKITVYLDWDDNEKKFPKKMKFSFANQGFELGGGFKFMKGSKSVIIPPKTLANQKNTEFKLENYKSKWYLVKSN